MTAVARCDRGDWEREYPTEADAADGLFAHYDAVHDPDRLHAVHVGLPWLSGTSGGRTERAWRGKQKSTRERLADRWKDPRNFA